jgi:hypothetical protein
MFYELPVKGQNLDLHFDNGKMIIRDIRKLADHHMVINAVGDEMYDWAKGNLYRYAVDKMVEVVLTKLSIIPRPDVVHEESYPYLFNSSYLKKVKNMSVVDNLVLKNGIVFYGVASMPEDIVTTQLFAGKVKVYVDKVRIYSKQDSIGEFNVNAPYEKDAIVNLFFDESTFNILKIKNTILDCNLKRSNIDSLVFFNVKFEKKFEIELSPLPKYIRLDGIVCNDKNERFDLTQFQITDSAKICDLNLGTGVASQIKANCKYFRLVFDSDILSYEKERIYNELLKMQSANYFLDGYEKLDKDYKEFKYLDRKSFIAKIQNWIDKHWWDYGYDKFMVIVNSVKLFLLFFAINLFAYKGLAKVYHPEKFKKFDERLDSNNTDVEFSVTTRVKNYLYRIPVIFLYTAFVFWGLKLDLKELEIKKPLYMIILIGQYVTGLICLAYIANYIISK